MKQIARIALALSATALLAGCYPYASGPQPVPPPRPIPQPAPRPPVDRPNFAWVGLGQMRNVDGVRVTPLRVIEDSRCPMNAKCTWAGNARVQLTVKGNKGSRTIELNTGRDPHVVTYDGYDFRMEDVVPSPGGDPKTPRPAPVLTISVEKHAN